MVKRDSKTKPADSMFFSCAFEAINDGNDAVHFSAGVDERLCGFQDLSAGGEYVFDEQDGIAPFQHAFDQLAGAVVFSRVADDDKRLAAGHRCGRRKGNRSQLRAGDTINLVADPFREKSAQGRQHVGLCFETVFIEVVTTPPPAPQREVAV